MDPANATSIDTAIFEGAITIEKAIAAPRFQGQLCTNSEASQWQLVLGQFL
jgi:hypothetical protein